jgi:hypothetical protein
MGITALEYDLSVVNQKTVNGTTEKWVKEKIIVSDPTNANVWCDHFSQKD